MAKESQVEDHLNTVAVEGQLMQSSYQKRLPKMMLPGYCQD